MAHTALTRSASDRRNVARPARSRRRTNPARVFEQLEVRALLAGFHYAPTVIQRSQSDFADSLALDTAGHVIFDDSLSNEIKASNSSGNSVSPLVSPQSSIGFSGLAVNEQGTTAAYCETDSDLSHVVATVPLSGGSATTVVNAALGAYGPVAINDSGTVVFNVPGGHGSQTGGIFLWQPPTPASSLSDVTPVAAGSLHLYGINDSGMVLFGGERVN